ncbi:MAG: 1-deoxy-D-xylulose-5-phosphate reductoisomerase [Clostridia bacterium]|nr:1-deoxy-D-xylulose-5-phosphate reductoisomerase [Clostridia bacterium]
MKTISLIGSTGSIGVQTLKVAARYPDKFRVKSLVANSSAEKFLEQIRLFRPEYAALVDEAAAKKIRNKIPAGVSFGAGERAALQALEYGDIAVIAASGFAGLKYSLRAAKRKKDIALANKETLVCGGELVMDEIKKAGVKLLPIDSEHSAIWQALDFSFDKPFKKLILTASGGPFYSFTKEELQKVTPKDALRHPTWSMGAKITIDSATLLNKGFEVIEAHHLYNVPLDKVDAIVQPESIIHSMVEFEDGGILAQMGYPSMELPIQLALTYPERFPCGVDSLDFAKLAQLRFLPLERKKFPCFDLALSAAEDGGVYPCALNAAGEIAVKAFLKGWIPFTGIAETIEDVLCKTRRAKAESYAVLEETDLKARALAQNGIFKKYSK